LATRPTSGVDDRTPGKSAAAQAGLLCSVIAIAETLTGRDLADTDWQRELSISHERLGDVLKAQGDLNGALAGGTGPCHMR
jgi:hypothetical protein